MDSGAPEPLAEHCARCGTAYRGGAAFCARCGLSRSAQAAEPVAGAESAETLAALRRRELRSVAWLYGLLMFTSLTFGLLQNLGPGGDPEPWITLSYGSIILAFAVWYRSELLARLHPSTLDRAALRCLGIAAVVQFAVLGAAFYLLGQLGIPFERVTDDIERYDYGLWQLLLWSSLAPAFFEEIAFRGIIFDRLSRVFREREAWLVQAALFSILHLSPVIFPTHFAMGLIAGWLRMRTGSLLPGMILHAAWNTAIILLELMA